MKYTVAILAAATGALAQSSSLGGGWNVSSVAYTTTVVTTALTTYCPEATELAIGGKTYTVTEATTLTITDCPCTLTQPIFTPSTILYTSCPPGIISTKASAGPSVSSPVNHAPVYSNPLTVSYTTPTTKPNSGLTNGTSMYTGKPVTYTGASHGNANSVTGLLVGAVAGVVAIAL